MFGSAKVNLHGKLSLEDILHCFLKSNFEVIERVVQCHIFHSQMQVSSISQEMKSEEQKNNGAITRWSEISDVLFIKTFAACRIGWNIYAACWTTMSISNLDAKLNIEVPCQAYSAMYCMSISFIHRWWRRMQFRWMQFISCSETYFWAK